MARRRIECPTCGKRLSYGRVGDVPWFPFCSRRCRLVDLDKWLEEEYRISRSSGGEPLEAPEDSKSESGG